MIRLLVFGSRDWTDRGLLERSIYDAAIIRGFSASGMGEEMVVVHGAARGADTMAADWATKFRVPTEPHPAEWERYGKSAGPRRNTTMAKLGADLAIGFFNGMSPGSRDMLERCVFHSIPVLVVPARKRVVTVASSG